MERRDFLRLTAGGIVGARTVHAHAPLAEAAGAAAAPHVVYVFSDTHRWCSMDFTETPQAITPNMAAMKTNGVSFSNCYSTLPLCSPHRALLMTGRWPWQQGFIANHMALEHRPDVREPQHASLAWMFRDAGYATHYVGKWHLGNTNSAPKYGFDTVSVWQNEDHSDLNYTPVGDGNLFGSGNGLKWDKDARYTGTPGAPAFSYKIVGEADQALLVLEHHMRHSAGKPLFLMLSMHDPHGPLRKEGKPLIPPHIRALYDRVGGIPFRDNDLVRDAEFLRDYHESITAVDEQLGRIRRKLRELGMADNTILVYSSDHGGLGGAQGIGSGNKRWPHDESSRVPFLVEWPAGIPQARRNREEEVLFSSIDIFPTLCGLAGLPRRLRNSGAQISLGYLEACPGLDHSRNVAGEPGGPDPESVFLCHTSNMNNRSPACPIWRTVVTKRYMYTVRGKGRLGSYQAWRDWDPQGEREWCLYDRRNDPHQMANLIADPTREDARRALRVELARWLSKAEIPFLETWFATHAQAGNWRDEHDGRGIEDAFDLWKFAPRPPETMTVSAHAQRGASGACRVTLSAAGTGDLPGTVYDVRYTTDGSRPTQQAPRYTEPLDIGPGGVAEAAVKALAFDPRGNPSDMAAFRISDLLAAGR